MDEGEEASETRLWVQLDWPGTWNGLADSEETIFYARTVESEVQGEEIGFG